MSDHMDDLPLIDVSDVDNEDWLRRVGALEHTDAYNPGQLRDKDGRFASGGGATAGGGKTTAAVSGGDPGFGIKRKDMPQIPSKHVPEFLDTLAGKGIRVERTTARAGDLKPTQSDLNPDKVAKLKGAADPNEKPIIVSEEGRILDGHHRWAGLVEHDPNQQIPVYKVHAPIETVLKEAHAFPHVVRQGVEETGPLKTPDGRTLPKVEKWVDHAEGMPEQTWMATMTGNPDKDPLAKPLNSRAPLHERIVNSAVENVAPVPADEQKIAILTMGGPASGKTSARKALGIDTSQFVVVDPDEVKERLPEYRQATGNAWKEGDGPRAAARDAAFMAHEESSYLAKQIRARAIAENKNVVIDGTGADAPKFVDLINKLKTNGYHVRVVYPDLDEETGVQRMYTRGEKSGRIVPEKIARPMYDKIANNFETIAKAADDFTVYDMRGTGPRKVWSKNDEGHETLHDPEFVANFRTKHFKG